MTQLTRDGWLLLVSKGTRNFGYGFLSVILGLYLDELGFTPVEVGFILTATLVGSALSVLEGLDYGPLLPKAKKPTGGGAAGGSEKKGAAG